MSDRTNAFSMLEDYENIQEESSSASESESESNHEDSSTEDQKPRGAESTSEVTDDGQWVTQSANKARRLAPNSSSREEGDRTVQKPFERHEKKKGINVFINDFDFIH